MTTSWRPTSAPASGPGSIPHHDGTTTYHKLEGDITFTDVDFGYVPNKTVLHNINLYGRPGQKIAFVGSTGAGKTTITNLINRFYDIQDGKIRYDGINIHKIKKADLRRSLGIVLQDTHLFTGTVMENIRYGRLEATDEECIAAARLANADGFIKRLPEGYNTMLTGDGANLSQGQRQLLAIARAAVADPPVLILDEATSSIAPAPRLWCSAAWTADVRPHQLRHRPPPLHCPQRRLHRGPGAGPHHRARQPRRAYRQEGQVLPALYRQSGRELNFIYRKPLCSFVAVQRLFLVFCRNLWYPVDVGLPTPFKLGKGVKNLWRHSFPSFCPSQPM